MSENEWNAVAATLAGYFPAMAERMTPEQARAWRNGLDRFAASDVQAAIERWYRSESEWPILARIIAQLRPQAATGPSGREAWKPCPADVVKAECERGRRMLAERRKQREAAGAKP